MVEIPEWILKKWQDITNLLAQIIDIPAALIMYTENEYMEVFVSSQSEGNPYHVGDKEKWYGLYCETVIKTQEELLVPNALENKEWNENPDIGLGMISYLGYPINLPDNKPFGTICVLDSKENNYTKEYKSLLQHFKEIIENDLLLLYEFKSKEDRLNSLLVRQNMKLQSLKEKAEESSRLKTEFLHNLSHEIRIPMNGIIGFLDILNKPGISDENRKSYSEIIQNCSFQLLRIIDDILEISSLETKQQKAYEETFNLNDMLSELFSIFSLKTKEGNIQLFLKKGLQDKQSHIISDKSLLTKILSNLLENAFKFTNAGSVELGYSVENEEIILYVRDTGIGISSENQEKIFERFTQEEKELSRLYGGLGLGLSISKENAELLRGNIRVESEKGKGSTFFVSIPYKAANNEIFESNTENTSMESVQERPINILLVEDEEHSYQLIKTLLEEELDFEYNLIHARNGKDAVEFCRENRNINIVLMDIKMPVMNGYDATEEIKSFRNDLPVIVQTAYTSKKDRRLAKMYGCNDLIEKPIDSNRFLGIIKKYVKQCQN